MAADPPPTNRTGRIWRALTALIALAFIGLLAYGLFTQASDTTIDDALAARRAVEPPGFQLAVLTDGRPGPLSAPWQRAAKDGQVALGELRGTPVVLNFWASWCIPCREEAPLLQRGWKSAQREGVLFLGLDMQDTREDAFAFIEGFDQDYPHVRDPTKDTARSWGATGIPETYFLSRQGKVVAHVIGALNQQQLDDGINAALGGRPLAPEAGGPRRAVR